MKEESTPAVANAPFRTAIVIPTYNRGAMVVEAARSALAQSVPVRVVVVDDGSTDDTAERLRRLGESVGAGRLVVIRQENRERGAARNRGAQESREAEFFLFLDADDFLEPTHVERLEALADRNPGSVLVTSALLLCDERLRPFGRAGVGEGEVTLEGFLRGEEVVSPIGTLLRGEAFRRIGGFDEDRALSGSEDWLLFARALLLGPGTRHPGATARMRRHPGNTMANAAGMLGSMLLARERFFESSPEGLPPPPAGLHRPCHANLLTRAATQFRESGDGRKARSLMWEAATVHPAIVLRPLWPLTWLRSLLPSGLDAGLGRWKRAAARAARQERGQ